MKTEKEIMSWVRPHILQLKPYASARDEYTGKEGVFLDANENPYGSVLNNPVNRYPDPHQQAVKEAIGRIRSVETERIFLGNGSDEAIDLLMRAFCAPNHHEIIVLPPTYGMYTVSAAINQVKTVSVSLTPSFQLDIPAIQAAITPQSRMLFICSPNNPTGNLIDRRDILSLVAQFPGLVVVDEAYIDFANDPGFLPVLEDHPNLIILQTLSKAWGMAGLRLGMAFAHPAIIRILNKIKPPYNISLPTQEIALANLQRADLKQALLETMLQERAQLLEALAKIPCIQHIFPTDANFVLISTAEPKKLYHYLIQQQIIVRDRSTVPLCEGCLRISVGTSEENIVLIKALETYSSLP